MEDVADATILNRKRKYWIHCVVEGMTEFHTTRTGRMAWTNNSCGGGGGGGGEKVRECGGEGKKNMKERGRNDAEAAAGRHVKAAAGDDPTVFATRRISVNTGIL